MLKIFAVMVAAMAIGWTVRRRKLPRKTLSTAVSCVIMALMLLIGIEMGSSESVLTVFYSIFTDAALLTIGAVGGTVVFAWLVNRYIVKSKIDKNRGGSKSGNLTFSFLIVGVFAFGVVIGYRDWMPLMVEQASMWALYLLMALVGFNIGSDVETLHALRRQHWKVVFVPVATIIGTLVGVMAISPLIGLKFTDCLAVGSGFGYYSLSSVLLSELRGVEIGAIALIVNVMRELITVVCAPLFVRWFSPLSVICSGGATTLDVTMPTIMNTCGTSFIGIAIFQGVVVDLSVPILVTIFATL